MYDSVEVSKLPKLWQTHFKKMAKFEKLPEYEWKPVHLLGYFAKKYKNMFGRDFAFDISQKATTKAPEFVFIKKIYFLLNTSSPSDIVEYFDWAFDNVIKKINLTSMGILIKQNVVNQFLKYKQDKYKIDKNTPLPPQFAQIASALNVSVFSYGDLAFIKKALQEDSESESRRPYKELFDHLYTMGLKPEVLESI